MLTMICGTTFAKEYSAGALYTNTNLENGYNLDGYLVKLLYTIEGDPKTYGFPEGLYQAGWQLERLNFSEESVYDLELTGAAVVVDGRVGENNLRFLVSNTIEYYLGERKDEINNTGEDIKGLGIVLSVRATYNIGDF